MNLFPKIQYMEPKSQEAARKASLREEGKPTDPNWEQLEDQLLPQCFLLPRLWEPKGTWIDTRIERKKLSEVLRQRIGGVDDIQPITNVTDFVKPFFCFLFVGYHQTTLLQNANLVSKRLNMLGIRYLVHHHIIKKAHPKRAVLREAG